MAQMIVAILGTAAWMGGVLILVVMAAIPLLEHFADSGRPVTAVGSSRAKTG